MAIRGGSDEYDFDWLDRVDGDGWEDPTWICGAGMRDAERCADSLGPASGCSLRRTGSCSSAWDDEPVERLEL